MEDDSHGQIALHRAGQNDGARRGSGRSAGLAATRTAKGVTVAEEHYACMIAVAHAPDVTFAHQAERYADAHWQEYVSAARAVLDARV